MKKVALAVMLALAVVACQKKEEPKGQYDGAPSGIVQSMEEIKLLQEVVKKDPGNGEAWIKLGNTLMDSSRFNEAIDAYQKALDIYPKNVDVRVDMGTCYRNIKRPDKAAEEYRKALAIDPRHVNGRKNLGIVLNFDLRDRVQAIKEFEAYLEIAPNDPDAGRIRQLVGELKAAK